MAIPLPPLTLASGPAVSSSGAAHSGGYTTFAPVYFRDDPQSKLIYLGAAAFVAVAVYLWKR